MEKLSKKKIVEILEIYDIDEYHWKLEIAANVFALHEAEIAKLQERIDLQININDRLLLELREAQAGIKKRDAIIDFLTATFDINNDPELRKQIETLKSEI